MFPPGARMVMAEFNWQEVSNPLITPWMPGNMALLIQLDKNNKLVEPSYQSISRETLTQGDTGLWNEKEVRHAYLEGRLQATPLFSNATTYTDESQVTDERIWWFSPDTFSNFESSVMIKSPRRTHQLSYHQIYSVGNEFSFHKSKSLISWSYQFDAKNPYVYPFHEKGTVVGTGGAYTDANGRIRYAGSISVDLIRLGKKLVDTYDFDVSLWQYNDLGTVISSELPDLPCAPSYFESMYDVPESFGDDVVSRLSLPDVNNVENLKDFKNLKELLPPLSKLIKKHNLKSLADFYLWYHYGAAPMIGDLESYISLFKKIISGIGNDYQTINLSYGYSRYKIIIDNYNAGVLQSLGLSLNLSNTWDCIPLSFVVDWFVKVGDVLSSIDSADITAQLKVQQVVSSYKRKGVLLMPRLIGSVLFSYYERRLSTHIPQSVVRLHAGDPSKHLLDASSLYLSKKR